MVYIAELLRINTDIKNNRDIKNSKTINNLKLGTFYIRVFRYQIAAIRTFWTTLRLFNLKMLTYNQSDIMIFIRKSGWKIIFDQTNLLTDNFVVQWCSRATIEYIEKLCRKRRAIYTLKRNSQKIDYKICVYETWFLLILMCSMLMTPWAQ